jgi:hypothetical protein
MIPLVTGPLCVEHVELGPVKVQPTFPVGAMEPVTPVRVAVKVITGPLAPLD